MASFYSTVSSSVILNFLPYTEPREFHERSTTERDLLIYRALLSSKQQAEPLNWFQWRFSFLRTEV
jgi:hypothetical protein